MKNILLFEQFIQEKEDKFSDYPKAASANAKKAIEWKEKYGRDEVQGGTAVGWQRAHQLAKGEAISRDVLGRMSAFNRHRKNSKISAEHKDTPWKDNGHIAWLIWGGDEGVDWAIKKMKELDESMSILPNDVVNEIGDRSVPAGQWLMTQSRPDHKGYSFVTSDEERYYAYFEKKPTKWLEQQGMMKVLQKGEKVWETSFGHLKGHIHGYGGQVDFKSATNKGQHFQILSTYAEIMEDFLKNNKGKADIIIAKPEKGSEGDQRRLRLYQAFLAKTKLFKNVTTESIFGQDVILLYL